MTPAKKTNNIDLGNFSIVNTSRTGKVISNT